MSEINVGIVGATGYTGTELVRLLHRHSRANIKAVTSESNAGKKYSDIFPSFTDIFDKELIKIEDLKKIKLDLIFLALPHKVSMGFLKEHGTMGAKIIDLSADFRLKSSEEYEKWYHTEHIAKNELKKVVYGLPEFFRNKIRNAKIVANPGCYPTSAILALGPLLKKGIIKNKGIIVDSKSGVSGAGAKASSKTHFPEVFGNFNAYGVGTHRHTPEIQSTLKEYSKKKVEVLFTPHLLPIDRGILTTTYSSPNHTIDEELLKEELINFYKGEKFVRVVDNPPSIKNVRGSNYCDIYVKYDERTNKVITVSVIDNLVKGAAGQAVQNMNIMFNFIESTGLKNPPLFP